MTGRGLADPPEAAPGDWSNVGDDRADEARDTLTRLVAIAREHDTPDALFAAGTLRELEVLQSRWPHAVSALFATMPYPWKAELLRLLRERAKTARKEEMGQPEGDWPGNGSIAPYLTAPASPRRMFVKDRLMANRAHVLAGIGGSSKTRFEYHMGVGGAIGRLPWASWEIERTGTSALLLAEDTADDVHQTIWTMAEAMQLSGDERVVLTERLFVFPMAGRDVRLLASVGGDLVETGKVGALIAALRALPPPLVFVGLDPALALTDGDELDQAHQRRLGELVDRIAIELDACVMLATHAGKSLQNAEEIGSHSARGGGALTDAVRAEYVLRTMTAAEARSFGIDSIEERKAHVQLVASKGNNLPPAAFAPLWLRRGSGGVLEAADLVPQAAPAIGPREVRALEILRDLAAVSAPRLGAWREACIRANLVTGATDRAREKAMDRIRDALLAGGLIEAGSTRGFYVPKVPE
jgi:hypothetical protein